MSGNNIQHSLDNAASLFAQRKFEEARQAYMTIAGAHPGCAEAWLRLAMLNQQGGDMTGAEECYRKAILIDSNNANSLGGWCALIQTMQRPEEANALINQLAEYPPDNPEACFHLALLCSSLGRHAEALDIIDRAINNAPQAPRYILVRADILARKCDFEESFDILKPFLEAQNPNPGAVLVFSNFCHVVGLKEECLRLLEKILNSGTTPPNLRVELNKAVDRVRNARLN